MVEKLGNVGEEDIETMLSTENIDNILRSRRSDDEPGKDILHEITVGSYPVVIHEFLGSGTSKEVYDVEIEGQHYALGLSGIIDPTSHIIWKWRQVIKEPDNTRRLRDLGLIVNDICEIVPATVNGYEFPLILMKKYTDHPFTIYDSKNKHRNNNPLIGMDDKVTVETASQLFSQIAKEIALLVRNGVKLGTDNFNLCMIHGTPHLYFYDLGSASFEGIPQKDVSTYVRYYAKYAMDAFLNSFSFDVYHGNPHLRRLDKLNGPLERSIRSQTRALL